MNTLAMQQTTNSIGEGKIDNFIIDSSLHLYNGIAVLVSMTVALAFVGHYAYRSQPISKAATYSLIVAQITLAIQLLLGIKLLDQGQGIVQLYIHYLGGLIPLGGFLVAGWLARGDNGTSSKILAGILLVSYFSCLAAFFIGRAYVNG